MADLILPSVQTTNKQRTLANVASAWARHVILFGRSKSGKTELAGTLAKKGFRLHWIDDEEGISTLRKLPPEAQENIVYYQIPDSALNPVAAETVTLFFVKGKGRICWEHGKVDCALCSRNKPQEFTSFDLTSLGPKDIVVLDSLTQYSNSIMAKICLDQNKGNSPDDWKADWDAYAQQGRVLHKVLSIIQTAKYHVLVITHEQEVKTEDGKELLVPTAGTSNFARNVGRYFGEVVYVQIKNRKHGAASSSLYDPSILTGSRSGISLENPEHRLEDIFNGKIPIVGPEVQDQKAVSGLAKDLAK